MRACEVNLIVATATACQQIAKRTREINPHYANITG